MIGTGGGGRGQAEGKAFHALALAAVVVLALRPQVRAGGAGSVFGDGLRLTNTAWALGLSEAMVASATGVSAIAMNPAGVLETGVMTAHLTHAFFVEGMSEDYVAFARRLPLGSALGVGLHGLYTGASERTQEDENGDYAGDTGGYPLGFFVGGIAYALNLSELIGLGGSLDLAAGAGVRLVWQNVDTRQWLGGSIDAGFKIRPGYGLTVGGVLQNLGGVNGESRLPLQWVTGLAWQKERVVGSTDRFMFEIDVPVAVDRRPSVRIGSEYQIRMNTVIFAVRAGWKEDIEVLRAPGLAGGFGFRWLMGSTPWGMDYAFVPWGVFGDLHAVALNVGFVPRKPEGNTPVQGIKGPDPIDVFYPLLGEKARIVMAVPERSSLSAAVLDREGNEILILVDGDLVEPGDTTVVWDGYLSTGMLAEFDKVYRIRIQAGGNTLYKDIVLKKE